MYLMVVSRLYNPLEVGGKGVVRKLATLRTYTMKTTFIERSQKAAWGIPCNQRANGSLWVGKGYECELGEQLGSDIEARVQEALEAGRGDRNGRFWVNLKKQLVTMQVGESYENKHHVESF
jgi:hypothetical protein